MAIFDWMANLAIDAAGGGKSVFGSRPGVADYVPTDAGTEAARAVSSNSANAPEIQALLDKILPGWSEMEKQGSRNTLSMLKGEIPQDVQDLLRRNSAYKAFAGGYGGSGMSKALTARDFGRTSLDLMDAGTNSAQRWSGMAQSAFAPFMVSARDQTETTFKNNLYKQAVDQFKFNVAAAPDPAAAGLFNTIATIGGTAASFGMGSAMGAARGGGGGSSVGSFGYAYPAPSYGGGYPTSNASGTAPYGWG